MFKKALQKTFKFSGIGTHSAKLADVIVEPAPIGTGISFIRTDLNNSVIIGSYENVVNTTASTVIANESGAVVKTIEHLMSALVSFGIFDAYIYINSDEMPILDGSATEFVKLIKKAGVIETSVPQEYCYIIDDVEVEDNLGRKLTLSPSKEFSVDIDLNVGPLKQNLYMKISESSYCNKIAKARTFGFFKDAEKLRSLGLIKGVSFDNSIVLDDKGIPMNEGGFRFKNETAAHKILDLIGDLGLIGMPIVCKVSGSPSHTLNNMIVKKCLTFSKKCAIVRNKVDAQRPLCVGRMVETRVQCL